jgi:hypothetical protein
MINSKNNVAGVATSITSTSRVADKKHHYHHRNHKD